MLKDLFGKPIKTNYTATVTLCSEGKFENFSFDTEKGKEELMIENLKEVFDMFDDILKINFTEKSVKMLGNRRLESIKSAKDYYIGEKLSLSEIDFYKKSDYRNFATMFNYDEYQIGGVMHPKTGIITPIYAVDKIIKPKENTRTIGR